MQHPRGIQLHEATSDVLAGLLAEPLSAVIHGYPVFLIIYVTSRYVFTVFYMEEIIVHTD